MSEIILLGNSKGKDCADWTPLSDGTKTGDTKYCDLSLECKQLGMQTDWYEFYNHEEARYDFDYFCTGCYPKDFEIGTDKEVT
jgi:hypothetical protein